MMGLYKVVAFTLVSSLIYAAPHEDRKKTPSHIDTIVVFGDSYSDVGNSYRLSNKTYPPSYYYNGRFSNGPLWPEYIQEFTQWKVLNYAYSGATISNKLIQGYSGYGQKIPIPSIVEQIKEHADFLARNPDGANPKSTQYVIVVSGNEYTYGNYTTTPEELAKTIYETSKLLFKPPFSGKYFMYANVALDRLAYNINSNIIINNLARFYRLKHNEILGKLVHSISEVNAKIFDMNEFLRNELSAPIYVNSTIPCIQDFITPNVVPKICEIPEKKLFWDLLHLSTMAHQRLANAIIKAATD
ncbi:hypothetical protein K7432_015214 [Basidiobolus ranarum]|uniref:Uncharacterized protein n=1 Tax=Basidiobolus ranarum TaxID=34480 RepID=A0ABR2WGP5_9FUNG